MLQRFTLILSDKETQTLLDLISNSTMQFQVTKQLFDAVVKQIQDQQQKAQLAAQAAQAKAAAPLVPVEVVA